MFSETLIRPASDQEILDAQQTSFQKASQRCLYPVNRHLYTKHMAGDFGYDAILPQLGNRSFPQILQSELEKRGRLKICDIGCGNGQALIDIKRQWPQVECLGLTAYPYYQESVQDDFATHLPTAGILQKLGIRLVCGDAQKFSQYFPAEEFSLIISVRATQYLANPWAMLEGIYYSLENEGLALISDFPTLLTQENNFWLLEHYLRKQFGIMLLPTGIVGSNTSRCNVIAQKQDSQPLSLPLQPVICGNHHSYLRYQVVL